MNYHHQTYASLVDLEHPNAPMREKMQRINELCNLNHPNEQKPFAQVDVQFTGILDLLSSSGTQREKDLVYVSQFFHQSWQTLHQSMMVLKEMPSPQEVDVIRKTAQALRRLELEHLLAEGLPKKYVAWMHHPEAPHPLKRANRSLTPSVASNPTP